MRLKNVFLAVAGVILAASVMYGTSVTSFAAVQDYMGSGAVEVPHYNLDDPSGTPGVYGRFESNAYVESNSTGISGVVTGIGVSPYYEGYNLLGFVEGSSIPSGSYRIGLNLPAKFVKGSEPIVILADGSGDYSIYNGNELVVSLQNNRSSLPFLYFQVFGLLPMPSPELTPEQISEQAYNQSVENSKREIANCDAASEVYFQGGGTIDDSVIASVASNPNATFLYSFPYNDELITLKITSEAAAACFDPEIKYYGPEWLMAHFPQVENEYIPN